MTGYKWLKYFIYNLVNHWKQLITLRKKEKTGSEVYGWKNYYNIWGKIIWIPCILLKFSWNLSTIKNIYKSFWMSFYEKQFFWKIQNSQFTFHDFIQPNHYELRLWTEKFYTTSPILLAVFFDIVDYLTNLGARCGGVGG